MRRIYVLLVVLLTCNLVGFYPVMAAETSRITGMKSLHGMPSYFIPNTVNSKTGKRLLSQTKAVAFVQTRQGRVLFTPDGAYLGIVTRKNVVPLKGISSGKEQIIKSLGKEGSADITVMKVGFAPAKGAENNSPRLLEKTGGIVNFLIGDSANWQTKIPTYRMLVYENAWTNADLQFLGFQDHLEYRLKLRPGFSLENLIMETGANLLSINKDGSLTAELSDGKLNIGTPIAWQIVNGQRVAIDVQYRILPAGKYGFILGSYDPAYTVTIDPTIEWASYLGNDTVGSTGGMGIVAPFGGYTYVTGIADSTFFATTTGAYDTDYNGGGYDAVVIKLDSTGSAEYSTFLGGNGDDVGLDVAVDSTGRGYVTGYTLSSNFPTTQGAYQSTSQGNGEAFIVALNSQGNSLEYSTLLGGTEEDQSLAIALNNSGVFVAGFTSSPDFPKVWDGSFSHSGYIGYDTAHNGYKDAFVAKFDATLSTLDFTTYLGGSLNDVANDLVLDESGDIFVAGYTYSTNFPTTSNAFQATNQGYDDGFAVKLSSTGTTLDYSTYLGGSGSDSLSGIALNKNLINQFMVAGTSTSSNFPITGNAFDNTLGGTQDAIVCQLTTGGGLKYSTYIGGNGVDAAYGLDYGAGDEFLIAGVTTSADFPVTPNALDSSLNGDMDGFVMWISTFLSQIDYSTYLGGENGDYCIDVAMALNPNLSVVVTGVTGSYSFPTTVDAWSTTYTGNPSGFVTCLDYHLSTTLFSTYFKGDIPDTGEAIAVDQNGANLYVAGNTTSLNFPTTPGVVDSTSDLDGEGFVTKFFYNGYDVMFTTYLGGNERDRIYGLALDDQHRPVIVGSTQSSNFPVTGTSWGTNLHDTSGDGFLTKLSADGSALVFSGYLGGMNFDSSDCIVLDETGAIYVGGTTLSSDFPVTNGAWDETFNNNWDGTITKLSPDGASILFSSFIGGGNADYVMGLALGTDHSVYMTGATNSTNFPTTSTVGPWGNSFNGGSQDAFVSRLSADGSGLIFSTYLGGNDYDQSEAILATDSGEAWVVGSSASSNFPTTSDSFDPTFNGTYDAFVTKVSADGSSLEASTFWGGSLDDYATGIVQSSGGQIVIAGVTASSDSPVTSNAMDNSLGGPADGFIAQLSDDATSLQYSSLIGGEHQDYIRGLTSDRYDNMYITGSTNSPDFPVTAGAYDTTNQAGFDAFACKLDWSAYTIHVTFGPNGAIIPHADVPVTAGGMKTFTIYPNNGYKIQDVTVDGVSQGILTHYTFTNVMEDHTIDVQFGVATDPPVIDSFTIDPVSGAAPLTSIYTVTAHAGTGHTITSYVWQSQVHNVFGSGSFITDTQTNQLQHTMYSPGQFSGRVCVIDETGTGTWSTEVDFNVSPPVPLPQPSSSPLPGSKVGNVATNTAVNPGSEPITITLQAFDSSHNEVGTSDIVVPENGSAELSLDPFENLDYTDVQVVSDTGLLFFTHLSDGISNMTAYLNQSQYDTLYLPHIAEETTYWNTSAFLTNEQRGSVTATVAGQDFSLDTTETLSVDLEAMLPQPIDEKTAWGKFKGVSNNPFSSAPTLSGYEMFVKEGSDGAATELVNHLAYTTYIPHIPEETDIFWTGFAIINPGDEDATVDFNFYDDIGMFVGHESKTIPAGEKLKGLMTDLFPAEAGNAKWGLISSSQALTGIEIFGTYQAGICGLTLPDHAQKSGILPDVWTGENLWTGFSLTNMGAFTANVLIQLFDKNGVMKAQRTESIETLNRFKAVAADYFSGVALSPGDSIRFTSDQPLTSLEVSGDIDRTVMAALTAAQ